MERVARVVNRLKEREAPWKKPVAASNQELCPVDTLINRRLVYTSLKAALVHETTNLYRP
jgi:hypothetical protein